MILPLKIHESNVGTIQGVGFAQVGEYLVLQERNFWCKLVHLSPEKSEDMEKGRMISTYALHNYIRGSVSL